jgi:class 3 adenylate cyclase
VHAAQELRAALLDEGIDIRVGIHVGDIDRRGDDVSGVAVNIGARVMALARPGELLASEAVPPVVTGADIVFHDRGRYELKGVPGHWSVYAVADQRAPSASEQ